MAKTSSPSKQTSSLRKHKKYSTGSTILTIVFVVI